MRKPRWAMVLAGGAGRRCAGQDKGLLPWQGRPLIEQTLTWISPQVDGVLISANRNLPHYRTYGWEVISDRWPGYAGPLAGIFSTLAALPETIEQVLVCACDQPQLPEALVDQLAGAITSAHQASFIITPDRAHYLPFLAQRQALAQQEQAFIDGELRSVHRLLERLGAIALPDHRAEAFLNLNDGVDA